MGFDTILKRYFPAVILSLTGVVAYFQASGVSRWVGSRFAVDASALALVPSVPAGAAQATASGEQHARTGEAIIGRNPFDSVTGPLNKVDAGPESTGPSAAPVDYSDPYSAPDCTDAGQLLIIAASDDPAWSMAVFSGGKGEGAGASKTQMRRVGDTVGTRRVWYIAWDRLWMQGDGQLCQLRMFKSAAAASAAAAAASAAAPASAKPPAGGVAAIPGDIASKIQKVSATEFNVDRSVVDKILENQAELMRSARIVPEQENGKVVGIRLFGIRPDTLLGTLGLENGDRLETINGFNMSSPDKALEAYARLRTANHLTVSVNRKGKPMNIDFNIK